MYCPSNIGHGPEISTHDWTEDMREQNVQVFLSSNNGHLYFALPFSPKL